MKKKILKSCLALIPCMCMSFGLFACDKHSHTYSGDWTYDSTSHWHSATCEHSEEITDKSAHAYGDDNICDVCAYQDSKLTYSLSSDESYYIVTGMEDKTIANLVVPSHYNGKVVKEIGKEAFSAELLASNPELDILEYDTTLKSITLPNTITKIGDEAFANSGLTSIVIPNSVTMIGKEALAGCRDLVSVTLSNNLNEISDYLFSFCYSLESVEIPESVLTIGREAFEGCVSLTNIVLPSKVVTIESSAFEASSIEYIVIPKSVVTIENGAFDENENLTKVYYTGTASEWSAIDNEETNILTSDKVYYYSETQPASAGNYWHYENNDIVIWS